MLEGSNLLDNDNIKKIRVRAISWDDICNDKEILFSVITNLLLNEENLLYYASQKESTKTLEDTKKYIKKLLNDNSLKISIEDVLNCIGWTKDVNIYNTVFQGDLAEYLMNILIDKITSIDTIISKVSLKTNSKMPVYGNDNYFYDYVNEILYFGESKFYNNFKSALKRANDSIEEHSKYEEISFVRNHTSMMIADNGEKRTQLIEKFETLFIDDIKTKSIIFVINDDIYKKEDYEKGMIDYYKGTEEINSICNEVIFVFLPIISKEKFLQYFKGRLDVNE